MRARRYQVACLVVVATALLVPPPATAQLTTLGSQYWDEDSPNIKDSAEADDSFGSSLATGDFDCDGYDDVAIGVPYEDVEDAVQTVQNSAGAVHILFGGKAGVATGARDLFITPFLTGVGNNDGPQAGAHFGFAVAAYEGGTDCGPRLAIGAPDFNTSSVAPNAGMVYLFRYSQTADDFLLVRTLRQSDFVDGAADESGDEFGYSLAAMKISNTDDCATEVGPMPGLAIGAPGEAIHLGAHDEGAVYVIHGAGCSVDPYAWELDLCDSDNSFFPCFTFDQEHPDFDTSAETDDRFGETLSARRHDRLVIGSPGENNGAGIVQAVYDPSDGAFVGETFSQDNLTHGAAEDFDHFGAALAEGDFDDDGDFDLAVGIPGEDIDGVGSAGAVAVIRASGEDLTHTGDQFWEQLDFAGTSEESGDHFGASLAVGDFDDNGIADLAIGVPDEDVAGATNAGLFNVLYGVSGSGLTATGGQTFTQNTGFVPGTPQECDSFGYALAAGDFDGANGADLAVGVPGENGTCSAQNVPQNNEGAINALYSTRNGSLSRISAAFSFSPVAENAGANTLTITKSGSSVIGASVHVQTELGTALPDVDYSPLDLDAVWPAGDDSLRTVDLAIIDNPNDEPNRSLDLRLLAPSAGASIVASTIPLTIQDDDVFTGFSDDFEADATAAWSSATATTNFFTHSNQVFYTGTFGQRAVLNDASPIFVQDDRPFSSTYHARFYLRLFQLAMSAGDSFLLFSGQTTGHDPVFELQVVGGASNQRFLRPIVYHANGSADVGTDVPFPDGRHAVEIAWTASTSPLTPNGTFRLKIDGTIETFKTGIANIFMAVDHVRMGAIAGLDAGTSGELGIDDFGSSVASNLNQLSAFSDVALADPLWNFIHSMYNDVVTRGCVSSSPRRFCATDTVSREQVADFIIRAMDGPRISVPPCAAAPFNDVPTGDSFCLFIKPFKDRGITQGCGGGNFCPKNPVRRGELAVFLARALALTTSACTVKPFNDVQTSDLRCPAIQAIKAQSISSGCGGGNFCTDSPVRRQELAILLQRAFDYRLPVLP